MADWRKNLDDLEIDDRIEIDCGDTIVCGRYIGMFKTEGGRWAVAVKVGTRKEIVTTSEIESLRIRQKAT